MNTEFCDILSMLRHERGVSQRNAASDLGISQALLSHYENGIREPGLAFVIKASKYYDVSSDYLLGISPLRCPEDPGNCPSEKKTLDKFPSVVSLGSALEITLKILCTYGDLELIEQATRYLSTATYKLMRYICMLNPQMKPVRITVPESSFSTLCNMDILLSEIRFNDKLKKCREYSTQSGYNQKYLDTDFLLLCKQLTELLANTDSRIARHLKEN